MRLALREDQEGLSSFSHRVNEETLSYEELLEDLKSHGKLIVLSLKNLLLKISVRFLTIMMLSEY